MIYSPNQEPPQKKGNIWLVNPSVKEFKTEYLDDSNKTIYITLAPLETREFKASEGQIVLNHLVDFILNEVGFSYKTDVNIEKADIRKRCVVYE